MTETPSQPDNKEKLAEAAKAPVVVPGDNISPGDQPKIKEQTEIGSNLKDVHPVVPESFEKILIDTRYTWDIFHSGNERAAVFTLSLVEADPEKVSDRFWQILAQNVSPNQVEKYRPHLKSIEVLG